MSIEFTKDTKRAICIVSDQLADDVTPGLPAEEFKAELAELTLDRLGFLGHTQADQEVSKLIKDNGYSDVTVAAAELLLY